MIRKFEGMVDLLIIEYIKTINEHTTDFTCIKAATTQHMILIQITIKKSSLHILPSSLSDGDASREDTPGSFSFLVFCPGP